MSQPIVRRWTEDEFFAWQRFQPERYEFVDGFPVRMMAGAKNAHDDIVVNLVAVLRDGLRGSGCRPFTADGSIRTAAGRIRRPDAGVDCGRRDPDGYKAAEPRLVAEVLSPSTRDLPTIEKVGEYKALETLDYILLIEPNAPDFVLWSRDAEREWVSARIDDLGEAIPLPALGLSLPLAELYDGIEFGPFPRLVIGGPA